MAKRRNRKRSGGIARQDYTKGGRVGYAKRGLVDKETGEVIEKVTPTLKRRVPVERLPTPSVAPPSTAAPAPDMPTSLSVGTPTPAPTPAPTKAPTPAPTTNKFPVGSDGEPIVPGEEDVKPIINVPGLPGYDSTSPTVYPTPNIPGITPSPAGQNLNLGTVNPVTGEEWWWITEGYATVGDALADGWMYDSETGTWEQDTTSSNDDDATTDDATTDDDADIEVGTVDTATGLVWNGTAYVRPEGVTDTSVWDVETSAWVEDPAVVAANKAAADLAEANRIAAENKAFMQDAKGRAERIASGNMVEGDVPQIQDPDKVITGEDEVASKMDVTAPVVAAPITKVADETVSQIGTTAQAATPTDVTASTMTADTVGTATQVDAATGQVADESLAKAAGVERIDPIQTAEVEIIEGALTERVVGVMSEDAKATAVKNVGSSLARITRAKKQLSNAGLSDADITELGNDPDSLEARLADFSEAERGIIEGLPEEALVSNQIDTLLKGIEEGEIPVWAKPAVASVEMMLAKRGMSASTVGRDALLNTIIQSAMPIAQSNAQAIQASVAQQKGIEAQESEANAARGQQTALTNASNVFQMNMAQFSADQQTALSNSKFLQTVGLTNASMKQQGILQDAATTAQMNMADADFYQKAQIQNAQSFLQTDLTNLSNQQQANVLEAQQTQQRILSNQSATNASRQFNATSENQTQQFMESLNAQVSQFNATQTNAVAQFNVTQTNAAEARDTQRQADVEKFNAQLKTQVDEFNSNQDFARNQWNAQNTAAVEAANVQWRRQANVANTAAQNAVNMANAQNAFAMSQTAQSFLWQELRDQADFDFRNTENEKNRIAQLVNTALAADPTKYNSSLGNLNNLIGLIAGDLEE